MAFLVTSVRVAVDVGVSVLALVTTDTSLTLRVMAEVLDKAAAVCDESPRDAADDTGLNRPWLNAVTSPNDVAELLKKEAASCEAEPKVPAEETGLNNPWLKALRSAKVRAELLGKVTAPCAAEPTVTASDAD